MTASATWQQARPLLLPYEGSASQLYVLDVPTSALPRALEVLKEEIPSLQTIGADGQAIDVGAPPGEPLPWADPASLSLRGQGPLAASISIYFLRSDGPDFWDIEFVFWADQLFPRPGDDDACSRSFGNVLRIIERVRSLIPTSRCGLSAREVGDPRSDPRALWLKPVL
jgi:hypothetical protein